MTTYKIKSDIEHFLAFTIDPVEFMQKMGDDYSPHFIGESRIEGWHEPVGKFFSAGKNKADIFQVPDVTVWSLGNLVLNEKAYGVLADDLAGLGEFLPVKCEGVQYQIFNCTNIVDDSLIDQANSEQIIENNLFMGLAKLAFHNSKLTSQLVFKTHYDNGAFIYCTDDFRDLVESNKLQGLVFDTDLVSY